MKVFALVSCILCLSLTTAHGQTPPAHLTGFGSGRLVPELEAEGKLLSLIVPDSLREIVRHLSGEVHVAGTPAQERTRDYVVERMRLAGIATQSIGPLSISLSANPAYSTSKVLVTGISGRYVDIRVLNILGETLLQSNGVGINKEGTLVQFDLSQIPAGEYVVEAIGDEGSLAHAMLTVKH